MMPGMSSENVTEIETLTYMAFSSGFFRLCRRSAFGSSFVLRSSRALPRRLFSLLIIALYLLLLYTARVDSIILKVENIPPVMPSK
ncbi:hypothetical protein K469DRAFT_698629 [Zopfia rhizophila CBS 207.26]|uniref:Uncharacterized protein n=1 Tax=Zopfia rhizophila CBS 207.26 TaxID=1314779 RepID=A0A6A6EWC7_9PEZI|nr:hypothetical protein K469DRAFT_698629 [Zopfia rhizophila CBS 207.26]